MSNLHDNAMLLLRYMLENHLVDPNEISPEELQAAVGLSNEDFETAENFVLQSRFVEATFTARSLTNIGVQYVTQALKQRIPVSLVGERFLGLLIRDVKDDESPPMQAIITELNITPAEYLQICQELEDLGFVKNYGDEYDPEPMPTKEGRLAFRRNFRENTNVPSIQAGAIFNAPVTGGNIQAIASAIDSKIQQNVSSLSSEELQKELEQTLQKLVDQVIEHLSLEQKAIYIQMAAEFQKEITQAKPDPGKLQKLLAGLGLLSDLGGTIDLGQKTFELIVKASPYILLLGQLAVQFLKHLPN